MDEGGSQPRERGWTFMGVVGSRQLEQQSVVDRAVLFDALSLIAARQPQPDRRLRIELLGTDPLIRRQLEVSTSSTLKNR